MSSKIRNILFLIGLVAIVVMCFTFEVSFITLWQYICKAGYWLVAILALWGVLYFMNTLAWKYIIKGSGDCPIPFIKLQKIMISGFALNYTTPIGLLGGEPYRIMELKPYIGIQRASSCVILFAMMHIFSHFLYWTTSIVTYLLLVWAGYLSLGAGMGTILVLMTLFCAGGIYMFVKGYKNGLTVKLMRLIIKIPFLRKWGTAFWEKHQADFEKIDSQISALQSQDKKAFYISLALEYTGRMLQSFEIMFMLILFDAGNDSLVVTFLYSFLILSFTSLFANLLGFLPLQLGGREGGFAMSVAQLGMTNEIGIFISIICRVRELFWAAIGLALMKIGTSITPKQ